MTLPKHPLLRAVLALWGLLFMLGMLLVGLLAGGTLLLWAWLSGKGRGRVPFAFGRQADLFGAVPRRPAQPAAVDVIEGEAREVPRG